MQHVRLACPEDADMLGAIHYRCWMETYAGLLDERILAARSARKSADRFRSEGCRNMLVALSGETAVGFCGFDPARAGQRDPSEGEIYGLYVLKEQQGRGMGSLLVQTALKKLQNEGFSSVFLWVLASNRKAVSFYERQGFMPDGEKTAVMLDIPVRELRFRMTLKNYPAIPV